MKRLGQWLFNLAAGVSAVVLIFTLFQCADLLPELHVGSLGPWSIDHTGAAGYRIELHGSLDIKVNAGRNYASGDEIPPHGYFSIHREPDSFDFAGLRHFRSTYRAFDSHWVPTATIFGSFERDSLSAPWVVLLFCILPIAWLIRRICNRSKMLAGCCPVCGYDLRATPERCPECGTAVQQVSDRLTH